MPAPAYNVGVHTALVDATRKGLSRRGCAGAAGISVRTALKWLEKGRRAAEAIEEGEECLAEDEKYVQLFYDVEHALAEREAELLALLGDDDRKVGMWMAQAWQLERRDPENWGPPASRVVHEGVVETRHTLELPQETAVKMHELFSEMARPKELTEGDG